MSTIVHTCSKSTKPKSLLAGSKAQGPERQGSHTSTNDRMELGHFGDAEPIGEGVSELRIFCGPGYRVYFTKRSSIVVVLLTGGDKSSQAKDIKLALELARQLEI